MLPVDDAIPGLHARHAVVAGARLANGRLRTSRVAGCVYRERPDIMRSRKRLCDRFGYGGVGIDGELPLHDPDPRGLEVGYVGVFAGRGALETAAQNFGGTIMLRTEKDPVTRAILSRTFPSARAVADFDDDDWRDWRRNKTMALGMLTRPPCGPYAPSGKGKFLSDPRAQYLLGIGTVACALQPETIDIEALYEIAGADGARELTKIDEVMNAANYRRIVPSNMTGMERVRASTHGSAVFRNRVLLYY